MRIVERAIQEAELREKNEAAARQAPMPAPVPAEPPPSQSSRGMTKSENLVVSFSAERLREAGRLPPLERSAQVAEEIRRIKWPVLNAIAGEGSVPKARNNVVLVTSAVPAEGKTFVSLNLALSIVRDQRMKVILVDGDVARPGMSESLGMDDHPGVNDLLAQPSMDVTEVLYPTDVAGLWFMPAGRWHEHSPELFAGDRMKEIAESLAGLATPGVVIVDSPPLLAATEATAIGRNIGQVLLIVRAGSTEQSAVLEALKLVDKSTPTYSILNCVEASIVDRYYGRHYYGDNYRYGRQAKDPGA